MQWLVLVHVLSAIVGVGPTFFAHVLMRRSQSLAELRTSLVVSKRLEYFPKIGGTIAVLSGLALAIFGQYGTFMQIWLIGALILYIYVQVIVIGFMAPTAGRLASYVLAPENVHTEKLPDEQQRLFAKANRLMWAASAGGFALFILMILKPAMTL